jgi:hypothetical protein
MLTESLYGTFDLTGEHVLFPNDLIYPEIIHVKGVQSPVWNIQEDE